MPRDSLLHRTFEELEREELRRSSAPTSSPVDDPLAIDLDFVAERFFLDGDADVDDEES